MPPIAAIARFLTFTLVWDLRAFKKPLATKSGLGTPYPNANALFSPDDKFVVTSDGAASRGSKGRIVFLRKETLEVVKAIECDATPVKVFWHSKINQVRYRISCGDRS